MGKDVKRCPCCGGRALLAFNDIGNFVACENVNTCAIRQIYFATKKEAIRAWNRRVDDVQKRN